MPSHSRNYTEYQFNDYIHLVESYQYAIANAVI